MYFMLKLMEIFVGRKKNGDPASNPPEDRKLCVGGQGVGGGITIFKRKNLKKTKKKFIELKTLWEFLLKKKIWDLIPSPNPGSPFLPPTHTNAATPPQNIKNNFEGPKLYGSHTISKLKNLFFVYYFFLMTVTVRKKNLFLFHYYYYYYHHF